MPLTPEEKQKILKFAAGLPAKRGIDIPADIYDTMWNVASGITQPLWGRNPTPWQMDWLDKMGAHTPEAIHDAFSALPHPYAPSVSVGEFQKYAKAQQIYEGHSR